MNVKTDHMFAVTTILDRSGRRVGSYLVDKSKDAPNRERKQQNPEKEAADRDEEAAVFEHTVFQQAEVLVSDKTRPAEPVEAVDPPPLDITV